MAQRPRDQGEYFPVVGFLLGEEVGGILLCKPNSAWLLLDLSTRWEEMGC